MSPESQADSLLLSHQGRHPTLTPSPGPTKKKKEECLGKADTGVLLSQTKPALDSPGTAIAELLPPLQGETWKQQECCIGQ